MSNEVAPIEVMLFLDNLFRSFDELIDNDPSLWKVETIGMSMMLFLVIPCVLCLLTLLCFACCCC